MGHPVSVTTGEVITSELATCTGACFSPRGEAATHCTLLSREDCFNVFVQSYFGHAAPQEMRTQTTVPGMRGTPREMCTYWVEIGQKAVRIGSESVAFGACAASKGTTWSRLCRS